MDAAPGEFPITFRRIDVARDADVVVANYHDACVASFGDDRSFMGRRAYLRWLSDRVTEYPDGHVLAYAGDACVGQLELQVPFGLAWGYTNLFYVARPFRRRGFGRRLHAFAETYFRAWEATTAELHVAPANTGAIAFYRAVGYRLAGVTDEGGRLWRMAKRLESTSLKVD